MFQHAQTVILILQYLLYNGCDRKNRGVLSLVKKISNSDSEQWLNFKVCVKLGRSVCVQCCLKHMAQKLFRNQVFPSGTHGSKMVEVTWKVLDRAVI
jgi:hypothetical protein